MAVSFTGVSAEHYNMIGNTNFLSAANQDSAGNGGILSLSFLKNVDLNLRKAVALATADYTHAITEIDRLVNFDASKIDDSCRSEFSSKRTLVVSNMQYIDQFKQRINHLTQSNELITSDAEMRSAAVAILHLNSFHLRTIELDLFESVMTIKELVADLLSICAKCGVDLDIHGLFRSTFATGAKVAVALRLLSRKAFEVVAIPIPPLSTIQVRRLTSVYTMQSERIVFQWFMNNMPEGSWPDLQLIYRSHRFVVDEESIEMF